MIDDNVELFYKLIKNQKDGKEAIPPDQKYPLSFFEKRNKPVILIPQSMMYLFDVAAKGYAELKRGEDFSLEAGIINKDICSFLNGVNGVNIFDLGGGDGRKGAQVAKFINSQGLKVSYHSIDGSQKMLNINREFIHSNQIQYGGGHHMSFSDFKKFQLNQFRQQGEMNLLLFLGSTYGNFKPDNICQIVNHHEIDLFYISNPTRPDQDTGEFIRRQILDYWNPVMRIGTLKKIGFKEEELQNYVMYNSEDNQIELYVFVKGVSSEKLKKIGIVSGDIFLTCISRKPSKEEFQRELSPYFKPTLLSDSQKEQYLTVGRCERWLD